MNTDQMGCLFCRNLSRCSTVEHIIPESLGNDDLVLKGEICDRCQNYFGKEVENYVLSKGPLAYWRVHIGIRSKKGTLPYVDLSQPKNDKGAWQDRHSHHDDGVKFGCSDDGERFIEVHNQSLWQKIHQGEKQTFQFVLTPKALFMMGRFLIKIGLELICLDRPEHARAATFDGARKYAREGAIKELWPLFYYSDGNLDDVRRLEQTLSGWVEHYTCYGFRLLECEGLVAGGPPYVLMELKVGTDVWIVCLSDRYPHPVIRGAFPNQELNLIWYSPEELSTPSS